MNAVIAARPRHACAPAAYPPISAHDMLAPAGLRPIGKIR
jgi:hypothetical protein